MNTSDVAAVLTVASGIDNRTITTDVATIWGQSLLADMSPQEAIDGVIAHYAESAEFVKPAHINALVRQKRRTMARDVPPIVPPRDLADEPAKEIRWIRHWEDAFIADHTENAARAIANREFDISEDEPPLAIEAHVGALREQLDRTTREMADRERMAQIQAEVDRQAKAKRRAEQLEAEKKRTAERKPEPTRELRDPAQVVAKHVEKEQV